EYREAIRLEPDRAPAHIGLSMALQAKGDLDGAIASAREATRLSPSFAHAHFQLGNALLAKVDLDGAVAEYREAIRLDPKSAAAGIALRQAERSATLAARLSAILHGVDAERPKYTAEWLQFAELCSKRQLHAAAARLYAEAFAADSGLADFVSN